jgi:hypothetical protein
MGLGKKKKPKPKKKVVVKKETTVKRTGTGSTKKKTEGKTGIYTRKLGRSK